MSKWVRRVNSVEQIEFAIKDASEALHAAILRGVTGVLTLTRPTRTLEQNRLMWPLLSDFSKQVEHCGKRYTPEQWKDLLTASFQGCVDYAPSLDGKMIVAFGVRTSKWPKDTFSQFIEYMYAEGTERGVTWSAQSKDSYSEVCH